MPELVISLLAIVKGGGAILVGLGICPWMPSCVCSLLKGMVRGDALCFKESIQRRDPDVPISNRLTEYCFSPFIVTLHKTL